MALSRLVTRRMGPLGVALTVYDVWRRIPPKQRAQILEQGRKHAPIAAAKLRETVRKGRQARARRRSQRPRG